MEALGPLVGETHLGVERLPIEVAEDGLKHCVRIGDGWISRSRTSCRSAWRPASRRRLTGVFHPAGSELTVSRATRSSINAFGIEYEAKAGFSASEFAWAA